MSTPTPGGKPAPSRPQQRLPAPSLFVGPSSRNTSAVDLRGLGSTTPGPSTLLKQRSFLNSRLDGARADPNDDSAQSDASPPTASRPTSRPQTQDANNSQALSQSQQRSQTQSQSQSQQPLQPQTAATATDKDPITPAWTTMRNTLSEIDITAAAGTTVFGTAHASALEDLRKAQIALAQAWGRSEAEDEAQVEGNEAEAESRARGEDGMSGQDGVLGGKNSSVLESDGLSVEAEERSTKGQLEEETENDIRLARKRRLANDRYFERVNKGVVDVVAKLEDVAAKMKRVEMESKEIWGEEYENSLDSG